MKEIKIHISSFENYGAIQKLERTINRVIRKINTLEKELKYLRK